ncbi:uncharacterized protein SCODWIG_00934 [Saccharomycodes ludwigii]|uniref:Trafficking protein particle complex subunit n=1 Tax=Saccharomycodes ludwigii TaxID=36035 RepID=A0A376B3B6_9ASCO|nr:hypothetical protein SCDLUD_003372 [Saccharomycodes ludwigii]KAH3900393.1 hypothetical protein SCDLUD_003372 [Saccharomycodes ludwigii]SSD59173.1 uncharacterized protein SCODWIG_00934 [Saccharomycodes ludwigii]
MPLQFVSIINPNNKPLAIENISSLTTDNKDPTEIAQNNDLKYNTFANMALDYFDSMLFDPLLQASPSGNNIMDSNTSIIHHNGSYIIRLFELENCTVYARLIKQIGLKFVLGTSTKTPSEKVIEYFDKLINIYTRVKSSPFIVNDDDFIDKLGNRIKRDFT